MAEIRVELEVAAGRLPEVCTRCGEPATTAKWKTMTWYPPWCNVLLIFGVLPAAIVMMILTKRASVKAPFCQRHSWHWLNRNLLMIATFFLFGAVGIAALVVITNLPRDLEQQFMPFVCIGDIALLVAWLVVVVVAQNTAIRTKEITDRDIVIAGLCDEFVHAVDEEDREYRRRRTKAKRILEEEEEADDEEEPRPRKSRPSTEVQADKPPPRKKRPASDEIEE
jgi:hypothetical protein